MRLATKPSLVAIATMLAFPSFGQTPMGTDPSKPQDAAQAASPATPGAAQPATGATGQDGVDGIPASSSAKGLSNAPVADTADAGDVVVTGSRIVRNGYSAPTPVTVLGAQQLQQQAVTRLVDFSRNLPQFRNQGGARSGSNGSANGGQGSLDLRGLGANRDLIMLDRRRVVPSTGNGIVDTNILPNMLVSRIDVVTGGASAAWGSDAVSGVVNFVLDTKFKGVRAEAIGGISSHGDDEEGSVGLAGGTDLGDRTHIIGSVEYFRGGNQKLLDRGWLAKKPGIINNPTATAANGQDKRILVSEGIVTSYMTHGGLIDGCRTSTGANIANCALKGTAFGAGGVPYKFTYGTYVNPTGNMIAPPGSDYVNDYTSLYDNINMVNPSDRVSLFSHIDHELTDRITIFAEGMYTRSKVGPSYTVPPYRFGTSATTWLSVTADNPYLPAPIKAQMSGPGGGNPAGPFALNVGRINDDWVGNSEINNTNTTYRGVVGAKGSLGGSWGFDGYYQYGRNTYAGTVQDNLITSRGGVPAAGNVNLAVDAIAAPAGNAAGIPAGTIICRSTLTNPGNGCKPLNIFGVGAASQDAIDYVLGDQYTRQTYQQHVVEASVHGDLFSLWAGPISLATGLSYRTEKIGAVSDPLSIESAFGIGNPKPYSGSYNVKEGFAELAIPLARDIPFIKLLDLSLAGRVTDYSTSGRVFTWKIGGSYEPFDGLRLRATRSRDIRAPSLQELYTGALQSRVSVTDPTKNSSATVNAQLYSGGNAALNPERADTFSAGIVYQPRWLPNFSVSVDYYNIKIADVISTITPQQIVDRCFAGNDALCGQITRLNGDIIEIRSPYLNLASLKTRGLDIETSYHTRLSGLFPSSDAEVGFRLLANYVDEFRSSDGVTVQEFAADMSSQQPKWTLQSTAYVKAGKWQVTAINRFIGSGNVSNLYIAPHEIDDNHVASRLYTNLNINYTADWLGSDSEIFFNVDNVFNVKPPKGFGWGYGLNASPMYDVIGPMFKVGIRVKY
ncbi:TonB-dependent receptor plug domain-containing protein [Sphingomonas crusticola]|uniref:TonB-dependent receptor plug domain-containing protein n=1 Tax=Sphingomonas crusticola TaxID=1697973 RepID=UPI000E2429AC|nr:TonB-dependent receptor [Sphingomonas crusticola]